MCNSDELRAYVVSMFIDVKLGCVSMLGSLIYCGGMRV